MKILVIISNAYNGTIDLYAEDVAEDQARVLLRCDGQSLSGDAEVMNYAISEPSFDTLSHASDRDINTEIVGLLHDSKIESDYTGSIKAEHVIRCFLD